MMRFPANTMRCRQRCIIASTSSVWPPAWTTTRARLPRFHSWYALKSLQLAESHESLLWMGSAASMMRCPVKRHTEEAGKAVPHACAPWRQDQYERVLLNLYVKPDRPVVSYLTPLTGCGSSGSCLELELCLCSNCFGLAHPRLGLLCTSHACAWCCTRCCLKTVPCTKNRLRLA